MATPKKIFLMERNHSVILSATKILHIFSQLHHVLNAEEMKELPSYPTFVRRLNKYQRLEFNPASKHVYVFRMMIPSQLKS